MLWKVVVTQESGAEISVTMSSSSKDENHQRQ